MHRALPEEALADRGDRRTEARGRARGAAGQALSARAQALLWIAQRASAAVLALCVVVHLVTMTVAIRGGLSAAEILSRTQGSVGWLAFYTLFVVAVAVHVPIGLRAVLGEWLGWQGRSRDLVLGAFALALAILGMRAVLGVYR